MVGWTGRPRARDGPLVTLRRYFSIIKKARRPGSRSFCLCRYLRAFQPVNQVFCRAAFDLNPILCEKTSTTRFSGQGQVLTNQRLDQLAP